jgi:hypothetical protein
MADALLHAAFLNASLRHCSSVAMVAMSPVVNARGPIFTHRCGIVSRPTYHVCELYTSLLAPEVLDSYARVPAFEANVPGRGPTKLPRGDMVVTVDRDSSNGRKVPVVLFHPHSDLLWDTWLVEHDGLYYLFYIRVPTEPRRPALRTVLDQHDRRGTLRGCSAWTTGRAARRSRRPAPPPA